MAWDGPILTDSGGFQVFSLRDTLLAVDDDGVTFRSVYDGAATRFTPELAARDPAQPRQRHRDVPRPRPAGRRRRGASSRTRCAARPSGRAASATPSARRGPAPLRDQPGRHRPRAPPPLGRGAARARLRRQRDRRPRDRRGPRARCSRRPTGSRPLLPPEKPRYFMGIGDAEGILEVIEAGVDMFDCVLPTRTARTGSAITWEGRLNLRNARFARDPAPLDESCDCPACTRVLAGLHPPPREPGRAARAAPALAPQSTLPARADPPRARGDRARRRSPPTNATHWSAWHMPTLILIVAAPRASPGSCSRCPSRRRQRSHAAMQDALAVGDEIITAGGLHAIVREVERRRAPDRDRARRRRHARPPRRRGRGRRDEETARRRSPPDQAENPRGRGFAPSYTCSSSLAVPPLSPHAPPCVCCSRRSPASRCSRSRARRSTGRCARASTSRAASRSCCRRSRRRATS